MHERNSRSTFFTEWSAWMETKLREREIVYFNSNWKDDNGMWFSLIKHMEQNPFWEANSHSPSQEIHRLLWNPKVQYHVHNNPPLVPILTQIHPVHIFSPYFPNVRSNIILQSMPRPSECSVYKEIYRLHNHITPWCSVLLENLIVTQLVTKFIAVFPRAEHWSLSWATRILSITSHPISLKSILWLFSNLCLCLSSVFPWDFPTKILYSLLVCPMRATRQIQPIVFHLITLITCGEAYKL
jgi:hypothetical protein